MVLSVIGKIDCSRFQKAKSIAQDLQDQMKLSASIQGMFQAQFQIFLQQKEIEYASPLVYLGPRFLGSLQQLENWARYQYTYDNPYTTRFFQQKAKEEKAIALVQDGKFYIQLEINIAGNQKKVVFETYAYLCPRTTKNFIQQSTEIVGTTFDRVLKGCFIMGGLKNETNYETQSFSIKHTEQGQLGISSQGGQFYVTLRDLPHLDNKFSVFGRVVQGLNTIRQISNLPLVFNMRPENPPRITKCYLLPFRAEKALLPKKTLLQYEKSLKSLIGDHKVEEPLPSVRPIGREEYYGCKIFQVIISLKMSGINQALPFLIINLGGQMMYIIDQRLTAQQITGEKAAKVREDVVRHLFSASFMDQLMRPQQLYTMASTRQVFQKLAHSSIMKLHPTSMNKLFDLMVMGLKMQLICCEQSQDLVSITNNHLEETKKLVFGSPAQTLVIRTQQLMNERYSMISVACLYRIRQHLLRFVQDKNLKSSLFLARGIQQRDGTVKLNSAVGCRGSDCPGTISKIAPTGVIISEIVLQTSLTNQYSVQRAACALGLNLYSSSSDPIEQEEEQKISSEMRKYQNLFESKRKEVAQWELNQLADMICPEGGEQFDIDLFGAGGIQVQEIESEGVNEVRAKVQNEEIDKFQKELEETGGDKGNTEEEDLLDLL